MANQAPPPSVSTPVPPPPVPAALAWWASFASQLVLDVSLVLAVVFGWKWHVLDASQGMLVLLPLATVRGVIAAQRSKQQQQQNTPPSVGGAAAVLLAIASAFGARKGA